MKWIVLFSISFISIGTTAQGPTLSLVGSSPSLTKGSINTELLTEIIQQKQEEVKQRVFRNIIVKHFKRFNANERLDNFTTYHYIYNLMDAITSGKNKTAITKQVIEASAEFAAIFGLAIYLQKDAAFVSRVMNLGKFTLSSSFIDAGKAGYTNSRVTVPKDDIKRVNLFMDICYNVILNDPKFQERFRFRENTNLLDFERWYQSDNVFLREHRSASPEERQQLDRAEQMVKNKLNELLLIADNIDTLQQNLQTLARTGNIPLAGTIEKVQASFMSYNCDELTNSVQKIKAEFAGSLNQLQLKMIQEAGHLVDSRFTDMKQVLAFFIGLKKNNFNSFTLSKNQFYGLKYILQEFLTLSSNQFENNVVAIMIHYLLENTMVEYADSDDKQLLETSVKNSSKGYLYVDVEAIIAAAEKKFAQYANKGLMLYIQPFFSIGTNYASFQKNNQLNNGNNLEGAYFASEKLGIRWKLWDWKYTHSFSAGESFTYFGKTRYWKRPQQVPAISNLHLMAYASGLLYNIANLKSEQSFNFTIAGAGLGIQFFNGLSVSAGYGRPIINKNFDPQNGFLYVGLDIPILDYIGAATKKK